MPIPKPMRDPTSYAAARVLEALLESLLALEFLRRGYTGDAVKKASQAWRALATMLLALKADKVARLLRSGERRWLLEKAVLRRVSSSRLKCLSHLLEKASVTDYSFAPIRRSTSTTTSTMGRTPTLKGANTVAARRQPMISSLWSRH